MTTITPVPAFQDNYIWAIENNEAGVCLIVDPGDARVVESYLAERDLTLAGILLTHHHHDHVGGVDALIATHDCPVYASEPNPFGTVSNRVKDGDEFELAGLKLRVIDVPGHTLDHNAYFSDEIAPAPVLFCGDTLFSGGCGRLFEGTPEQLFRSLQRLTGLPPETRVYCAHEYTLSNLRFARNVEPGNRALADYQSMCESWRSAGRPTLPSTIQTELTINPFLRTHAKEVRAFARSHASLNNQATDVDVFAALRKLKDRF